MPYVVCFLLPTLISHRHSICLEKFFFFFSNIATSVLVGDRLLSHGNSSRRDNRVIMYHKFPLPAKFLTSFVTQSSLDIILSHDRGSNVSRN